jgi:hypothetical protein
MLARLRDELRECLAHMEECERKAKDSNTPAAMREDFARLAESWKRLAKHMGFAAKISGYIEFQAQRFPDFKFGD